jgi:hypothetical protein
MNFGIFPYLNKEITFISVWETEISLVLGGLSDIVRIKYPEIIVSALTTFFLMGISLWSIDLKWMHIVLLSGKFLHIFLCWTNSLSATVKGP